MAARRLHSRILPYLVRKQPQTSLFKEHWQSSLLSRTAFGRAEYLRQGIQTQSLPANQGSEDAEENEACSQKPERSEAEVHFHSTSNLKVSSRHDLAMIFTCKVCETRSMKTVCRESYEKGVVVVRCGGCSNLHLIADRLGWFGEPGSIEDLLAARGEEVKKGSIDSLNLTLEDLAGTKP
ncbi:hypothetical protein Nepgr_001256 [Nepenthes gracilis]|uniref:DNL-type domain-containing protein n=1 Tax=Nepenthes gracilis TaxID=150966 RepID=A0AAD3RVY3_NEPGR|nr:hypothetical protein Nepgr_001256 [Nepenthes gracilis]